MLEILQEKNKGKIVFIKLGAFYIATGQDAVLLLEKLELKCTCFLNRVCKIGIPITSIEKYKDKLDELKYAYIIYDYNKEKNEIKEQYVKASKLNKEEKRNINKNILYKIISKKVVDEKVLRVKTNNIFNQRRKRTTNSEITHHKHLQIYI